MPQLKLNRTFSEQTGEKHVCTELRFHSEVAEWCALVSSSRNSALLHASSVCSLCWTDTDMGKSQSQLAKNKDESQDRSTHQLRVQGLWDREGREEWRRITVPLCGVHWTGQCDMSHVSGDGQNTKRWSIFYPLRLHGHTTFVVNNPSQSSPTLITTPPQRFSYIFLFHNNEKKEMMCNNSIMSTS